MNSYEVRFDESLEAPVLFIDLSNQELAFAGEVTVYLVKGTHGCRRISKLDRRLKGGR